MITIIQLLSASLILISFFETVSVPVVLASPGEWEKSKNLIFQGAGLWSSLVLLTGLVNSFVA